MSLSDYLAGSTGQWPAKGSVGQVSEWFDVGTLQIRTGRLGLLDPQSFKPDDGVDVGVPPGRYRIAGRGVDFDGHRRVSALRVVLEGRTPVRRGKAIGNVSVDLAMIVAVDLGDFIERFDDDWDDELSDVVGEFRPDGVEMTTFQLDDEFFHVAVAESGLGDGEYPAFAITSASRVVGAEVEFIPAGTVMA